MYVLRHCEARSRNHCWSLNAISIVYPEYVSVALLIQHAKCMRLIILSYVARSALQNFSYITSTRARVSE